MNKKTLLFSNVVGNIMEDDETIRFNDYMNEYLSKSIDSSYSMIFIDAPGLGGEENYLSNILRCFNKIGIHFSNVLSINELTSKEEVELFLKENNKVLYFLMGGDPYSQIKIIDHLDLRESINKHEDLVIGFCAGAINLSLYSIITTDEDFKRPDSYTGIGRESICIEPHYNNPNDFKRNEELKTFSKDLNTPIICIPDESIVYFENGNKQEKGVIYTIDDRV